MSLILLPIASALLLYLGLIFHYLSDECAKSHQMLYGILCEFLAIPILLLGVGFGVCFISELLKIFG